MQNFDGTSLAFTILGILLGTPIALAFSPLLGGHGHGRVSLNSAVAHSLATTDWHVFARIRAQFPSGGSTKTRTNDEELAAALVALVVLVTIVTAYVRNAVLIAGLMAGLSILATVVVTITFTVLWCRGAVDGRGIAARLAAVYIAVIAGVLSALWLVEPPLHADALDALATALRDGGSIFDADGVHVGVIVTQMFAALFTFGLLIACIALGLGSVAAVYVHSSSRPRWLWKFAFWTNRWAMHALTWWTLFILASLSLIMTSGLGFDWLTSAFAWINERIDSLLPATPAPAPAPAPN